MFKSGQAFSERLLKKIDSSGLKELSTKEKSELHQLIEERVESSKGGSTALDWEETWGGEGRLDQENSDNKNLPRYLKKSNFYRFMDSYWTGPDDFIQNAHELIISEVLQEFVDQNKMKKLVEIGCGLGQNLIIASRIFKNPDTRIYGLDWSKNSIAEIKKLNQKIDSRIDGEIVDLRSMNHEIYNLIEGSTVFSVHALEQLGDKLTILDALLENGASKVVTVEPMIFSYLNKFDADNLLKFHLARGYLFGYEHWLLLNHYVQKRIEIENWSHIPIGTYDIESYSIVSWKPTKNL